MSATIPPTDDDPRSHAERRNDFARLAALMLLWAETPILGVDRREHWTNEADVLARKAEMEAGASEWETLVGPAPA